MPDKLAWETSPLLTTRRTTEKDAALIAHQRRAMFQEAISPVPTTLEAMETAFTTWVREQLLAERYLGWIVEDGPQPIAGGALWRMEFPPHFLQPVTERGYLLNFYVEPAYRGRGIARELLELTLAEARSLNLRVVSLHASKFGRPLYEREGFRQNNEMILLTDGSLDAMV